MEVVVFPDSKVPGVHEDERAQAIPGYNEAGHRPFVEWKPPHADGDGDGIGHAGSHAEHAAVCERQEPWVDPYGPHADENPEGAQEASKEKGHFRTEFMFQEPT